MQLLRCNHSGGKLTPLDPLQPVVSHYFLIQQTLDIRSLDLVLLTEFLGRDFGLLDLTVTLLGQVSSAPVFTQDPSREERGDVKTLNFVVSLSKFTPAAVVLSLFMPTTQKLRDKEPTH